MRPSHPHNLRTPVDAWPYPSIAAPLFTSHSVKKPENKPSVETVPASLTASRTALLADIEAVLFLANEPLSLRRIGQMASCPEKRSLRALLRELNELYDAEQSAFHIVEVAGGFQLRSRPEFAPWLVRLQKVPIAVRLSTPAMETLAVIAYRQPVTRIEIERLRGVHCGDLIRQLLDRDLVKIVGRSEELGRPRLYGTTKTFLTVFGLGGIQDLPDYQECAPVK